MQASLLQLPPSAESAKAAEVLKSFPGGDRVPAILVVTRRDGSALAPGDLAAAESARQRALSTHRCRRFAADCFAGRPRGGGADSLPAATSGFELNEADHRAPHSCGSRVCLLTLRLK